VTGLRGYLLYAVLTVVLSVAAGWALTLAFHGPGDARAIRLSAVVAVVVQIVAFGLVRRLARGQMMVGWGAGALLRFLTLFVYGLLVIKVLAIAPAAALVALAACLFITTLIEPLFLSR
jgi:hypothetical protein